MSLSDEAFPLGEYVIFHPLILHSFVAVISSEDYKVSFKERFGIDEDMYAGFMPIKLEPKRNNEGNFFFWLIKQRRKTPESNRKLVIWLNGGTTIDPFESISHINGHFFPLFLSSGPGCSSMVGMLWENGPFTMTDAADGIDYILKSNPYSWNEEADVLYVEQPIRTGFSTAASGIVSYTPCTS